MFVDQIKIAWLGIIFSIGLFWILIIHFFHTYTLRPDSQLQQEKNNNKAFSPSKWMVYWSAPFYTFFGSPIVEKCYKALFAIIVVLTFEFSSKNNRYLRTKIIVIFGLNFWLKIHLKQVCNFVRYLNFWKKISGKKNNRKICGRNALR